MLFNSISFAIFLPIVFILYWFVVPNTIRLQNGLLLIAGYVFYGFWDYRFLFLLAFSTLLDYVSGIQIHRSQNDKSRKYWFWLSIGINLGLLGVFKYYNFFIESFQDLLAGLGMHLNDLTISVILPVGISFYTFHGISYVVDVYHKKIEPEYNFVNYSVFVSFFPLLVAGPIERATHLLPQIKQPRVFNQANAIDGMRQILWGLVKKIVIADSCAIYVNMVFADPGSFSGSTLALAAVLFAFQIYCDFSGYSDIAIGTAKLFGISLLRNFSFPYFSRDIAEFWRRWHMSLSSWFRDYVYIPLGGSKAGKAVVIRNVFIIFLLSGFWHGANWTFLAWGFINAVYFLPVLLVNRNRVHIDTVASTSFFPSGKEFLQISFTFLLTVIAWIFFRSGTIHEAFVYLKGIFTTSFFQQPQLFPFTTILIVCIFVLIEWIQRHKEHPLQFQLPQYVRWMVYYGLLLVIYLFGAKQQAFIYFKF